MGEGALFIETVFCLIQRDATGVHKESYLKTNTIMSDYNSHLMYL